MPNKIKTPNYGYGNISRNGPHLVHLGQPENEAGGSTHSKVTAKSDRYDCTYYHTVFMDIKYTLN